MNVSVGQRWERFLEELVQDGRYGSVSEVVREGLRLVEEREAKLKTLRDQLQAAVDEDIWYTADEVVDYINIGLQEDKPKGAA